MSLIADLTAAMFEECWKCGGHGRDTESPAAVAAYRESGRVLPCSVCRRRGRLLTEEGKALLEALHPFLADHFSEHDHGHGPAYSV